ETTPFLNDFAKESLVAENALVNGGGTRISLISMLTGRSPFSNGVFKREQILMGSNAFLSLPAVLKTQGYSVHQFAVNGWADAWTENFWPAFDRVNGLEVRHFLEPLIPDSITPWVSDDFPFFVSLTESLTDRLFHLFGSSKM